MSHHWPGLVPNLTMWFPGHKTTHSPFPTIRTTKFKGTHVPTRTPFPTRTTPHHFFLTPLEEPEDFYSTTESEPPPGNTDLTWDDATWVLLCTFIIFTMQSGFGLLESGCVSIRNESNIMMKNIVDIVLGGITYWIFGFSLSFGSAPGSNGFVGVGDYVVDADYDNFGAVFVGFIFQLSFATTATTIVSGAMAERCNFKAYCVFSLLNTIVYCVPARWVWGTGGFLNEMGCIDIAGSGAVHLLGGASGFVAAWMLGPRLGRYDKNTDPVPLGNPTSCISVMFLTRSYFLSLKSFLVGLYILWWGWLAFNSGSTFGVTGDKWKFATRAAVTTIVASMGGGIVGSIWTVCKPGNIFEVMDIVNPVLGGLVGVTAGCALFHTFDALVVGMVGGVVILVTGGFADYFRIDDPVGATSVHGFGGIWGLLAVGFFAEDDNGAGFSKGNAGVLRGGTLYLLCVQLLACVCIIAWAMTVTFSLLWITDKIIPIRMTLEEEVLGADFMEHLIRRKDAGITPALSLVGSFSNVKDAVKNAAIVSRSVPTHDRILDVIDEISGRKRWRKAKNTTTVVAVIPSQPKPMAVLQKEEANQICTQEYGYGYNMNMWSTNYNTAINYGVNTRKISASIRPLPIAYESTWHYRDSLGESMVPKRFLT